MNRQLSKKAKIIISSILVFILVLGSIAIWAADRYLIEHVELDLSEEIPAGNQVVTKVGSDINGESIPNEDSLASEAGVSLATPKIETSATPVKAIPVASKVEPSITPDENISATVKEEPLVTPERDLSETPKAQLIESDGAEASKDDQVKKDDAKDDDVGNQEDIGAEKYTATDMSYTSDSKTINIQKVVTGEGKDTVTYYVADIKLTDATQMKSAFAKNKFGLNIIEETSVIAKENDAILAINGDYYGFRKDGIEIRNGRLFRNEPARTGLAFYKDGSMKIYDEKQTTGEELLANGVWNTISFGPSLVIDGKMGSNLATYQVDTNFGNHPIQGLQPRTGIGMIDNYHFVFVVVDGRNKGHSRGVELEEFAQIFQSLGCKTAYNIDGGGSATMYFMGNRINNPCGKSKERGTSDIIYIK